VNAGTTEPHVMDLRGAGELGDNSFIIAGGIGTTRTVLDSVWLVTATGVSVDEVMEQELFVAPNPTNGRCVIHLPQGARNTPYVVRDALGRSVRAGSVEGLELILDLSGEAPGAYILHLANEGAGSIQRAVVIRE